MMNHDTEHQKKMEDAFLSHLGYSNVNRICNELDTKKQEIDNIEFPRDLDDKMFTMFQEEKKQQVLQFKKKKRHGAIRYLSQIAAVFVAVFLVANIYLVSTVDAYRSKILSMFVDSNDRYSELEFRDDEGTTNSADLPEGWSGLYPGYIPEGFVLTNHLSNDNSKQLFYNNDTDGWIDIIMMSRNSKSIIDTEDAEVETVDIHGLEALYVSKNGDRSVTWCIEENVIMVFTNQSREELFRMAEAIKTK